MTWVLILILTGGFGPRVSTSTTTLPGFDTAAACQAAGAGALRRAQKLQEVDGTYYCVQVRR